MGVRGVGATRAEAFEQAALALAAVITDPLTVTPSVPVEIDCEAPDIELLFVDWLNALIYEMDTRKMLFGRFKVKLDSLRLTATVWGETTDVTRHQPAVEIKGATYAALRVARDSDRWIAQTVVDV